MSTILTLKDIIEPSNKSKSKQPKINWLSDNVAKLYVNSIYEPSIITKDKEVKVEYTEYLEIGTGYKISKEIDLSKVTLLACPSIQSLIKYDIIGSSFYLNTESYTEIRFRCKITPKAYEDFMEYIELNIPTVNSSILELRLLNN